MPVWNFPAQRNEGSCNNWKASPLLIHIHSNIGFEIKASNNFLIYFGIEEQKNLVCVLGWWDFISAWQIGSLRIILEGYHCFQGSFYETACGKNKAVGIFQGEIWVKVHVFADFFLFSDMEII